MQRDHSVVSVMVNDGVLIFYALSLHECRVPNVCLCPRECHSHHIAITLLCYAVHNFQLCCMTYMQFLAARSR